MVASDKTGTLTRNEMTVRVVVTASGSEALSLGYAPTVEVRPRRGGKIAGVLRVELERRSRCKQANNAAVHDRDGRWTVQGDPTEGALLVATRKADWQPTHSQAVRTHCGSPFSSERKLMSTVHRDAERRRGIMFTKGAPDMLLRPGAHEVVGEDQAAHTGTQGRNSASQ